uniref:3TM-type holin n=1 Tax=Methylobacterium sp. B34 TaxID=95563 RepID=UPI00034DBF86|nr:3TM-type holin [Methylobacterium sp. B34]
MVADATSESKLTRNARPIVCFAMLFLLFWIGMIGPSVDVIWPSAHITTATITNLSKVPDQVWSCMMIAIGGYMAARSVEKITDNISKK